jgi:exodeoxyribonuclease VII large subunit
MENLAYIIPANSVEYSVSDISREIKKIIEGNFAQVRIKGEISGLKIATSGHAYLSLKDENSVLACTCWKHALAKMKFKPEDGMQVIATGKITIYAGQSKYQLSIDSLEADGVGALMQILEKRKKQLQEEGLFDQSRKKRLPYFPKKIGVITSLSGAVIRDILHRIKDRCPTHLIIWPVAVQGEGAADEIAKAIWGFNNRMPDHLKPDLLIIARGGGSIEDLWAFNEEVLVRAAASSGVPIISAIGHETDFTLLDFVADMRAPTPTAAAEIAVPIVKDLKIYLQELNWRLVKYTNSYLNEQANRLNFIFARLANPFDRIMHYEQKLDYLLDRMYGAMRLLLNKMMMRLQQLDISRTLPNRIISAHQERLIIMMREVRKSLFSDLRINYLRLMNLDMRNRQESLFYHLQNLNLNLERLGNALNKAMINYININQDKLSMLEGLMLSMDYKQVLRRGFAIIKADSGNIISNTKSIGNNFIIEMHDGEIKINLD